MVRSAAMIFLLATGAACATSSASFPWPARGPAVVAVRAGVTTANPSYRRQTSQVLVRKIARPTRASLDYAAYHGNFMNADPPPAGEPGGHPRVDHPFAGVLVPESLTGSVARTPLSASEREHALALPPLLELMLSRKVAGADRLEDVVAEVRAERWGLPGGPQLVRQTATELFLHGRAGQIELWLKIELAPWFTGFSSLPDEDGDGHPEIYGRIAESALGATDEMVRFIRTEYEGRALGPAEVKAWANQLASYWYPSYNTDLVPAPAVWPTAETEPAIRAELAGLTFAAPAVVMRGKPLGVPVYNVFLVEGMAAVEPDHASTPAARLELPPTQPSPDPAPVQAAVSAELAAHGKTWKAWSAEVVGFRRALAKRRERIPSGAKAMAGSEGFLFFRQSLDYVLGGDLANQQGDRNPIPVIVEFQRLLHEHGVDFLFVPIPSKEEIYPDKTGAVPGAPLRGQIVNPYARKLLLDLAERGVETVDLLPAFLAERRADKGEVPLFQTQDTHWTTQGLELAAHLVAERIERYPWYPAIRAARRTFTTKAEAFTRHGDLFARLPEAERTGIEPETLLGHQVVNPDGSLYEDDPQSPIVVLGDSFTGVYQRMDCEHAGVSAHIAKEIGYPVDLLMSYGGGPNVREKLVKRGMDRLRQKKLVIWMMTARDLFAHEEGWHPLDKP